MYDWAFWAFAVGFGFRTGWWVVDMGAAFIEGICQGIEKRQAKKSAARVSHSRQD